MKWFWKLLSVFRAKVESVEESSPAPDEVARDEETGLTLPVASELADLAEKSFNRQADLDESVWRSLPFVAAVIAIAVTVMVKVADGLPMLEWRAASVLANALFWFAVISFAWTLRWFWEVLRPRDYEYPAADAEIRSYAEHVTAFYGSEGLAGKALSNRVLLDLKLFLGKHLGDAARANLRHNVTRLKARSQLLLFVLLGFALVILAEGITYVSTLGTERTVNGSAAKEQRTSRNARGVGGSNDSAKSAQTAGDPRGRGVHEAQLRNQDSEQVMGKQSAPKPTQSQTPKPAPPAPQLIKKQEQGSPKPGNKSR